MIKNIDTGVINAMAIMWLSLSTLLGAFWGYHKKSLYEFMMGALISSIIVIAILGLLLSIWAIFI